MPRTPGEEWKPGDGDIDIVAHSHTVASPIRTPGPWATQYDRSIKQQTEASLWDAVHKSVWDVDNEMSIATTTGQHINITARIPASSVADGDAINDAANAHLIAAAPDLLAACRRIAAAPHGVALGDLESIHAAIAKAEGRTP